MPTVAGYTLGCKVNQYDTQAMLEALEHVGYRIVPFGERADIYLINTCTVTGTGDQKSLQMIRRVARQNPDAEIIVTGCLAQRAQEKLRLPGVRLILGTQRRGEVAALLAASRAAEAPMMAVEPLFGAPYEPLMVSRSEGRTRAALKIQEGCDGRCTYCIIPSVRGAVRSRPLKDIGAEAKRLAGAGFCEVVLTGIHLGSYGRDLGDVTLTDAIRAVHAVEGIVRIRLGSLEPRIVTHEFVQSLKELPKVCPHFPLALQSGSETVLKRMARRYTTTQYAKAAALLHSAFPGMALNTDVMVGFPGETEEEFRESMAFLEQMGFARIHVFPYSPREGTPAFSMPGQVSKDTKARRAREMIALGERLAGAYIGQLLGTVQEVLLEEEAPGGLTEGYTPQYIRVRAPGRPGERVQARLVKTFEDGAIGETLREGIGSADR